VYDLKSSRLVGTLIAVGRSRPVSIKEKITVSDRQRGRRLVRQKDARARLGIGKTKYYEQFIKTGRLHLIPLGPKSFAVDEAELDAVIAEVIAEGKVTDRTPLARNSVSGQFVKASSRKSAKEIRP
jgi:hypothetical protein